jgi:uncharacterized protein (DUF433 family)
MDPRFDVPLFTRAETATHLRLAPSTLNDWLRSGTLLTVGDSRRGETIVPFISLVEAHVLQHLRGAGLSLRAIRDATKSLRKEFSRPYPLAWKGLAHDGTDLLRDLADHDQDPSWERVRDRQGGIQGVVELGLQPVTWAPDDYASRLKLVAYEGADVIVDPRFSFGQPILERTGVRVEDVVDLARAGEPYSVIADEFGIDTTDVEALVRPHIRAA